MAFVAKPLPSPLYGDPGQFVTSVTVLNRQGASSVIGTPTVNVKELSDGGHVLWCDSLSAPTNADAGYATGCLYIVSTGGTATTLYLNEGSSTSATWVVLSASTGGGGGGLSIPYSETDATTTTGTTAQITSTALTTGSVYGATVSTGVFTTGGSVFKANMSAAIAGNGFYAVTTGAYTGTGLLLITANSATTGVVAAINATGLTTGSGLTITTSTGMTAGSGAALKFAMGTGIGGGAIAITNTGAYADTAGIIAITANTLTSGSIEVASATSQTSGILYSITGGGSNITSSGIVLDLELGAATAGTGLKVLTSGIFAGSNNLALFSANSATTTTGIVSITGTGLTSGVGLLVTGGGANITSTGSVVSVGMGAATTGNGISVVSTGVYTSAGAGTGLVNITGNSATTTTGLIQISGTGLTSGQAFLITGGGVNITSGSATQKILMGAATTGIGLQITSTGTYTGVAGNGLLNVTANSANTTAGLLQVSGLGLTTGVGILVNATAATLTTGRYISVNDAATEVFGVGANGHIHSTVSAVPPTIAVTTANGISAAAITAGGTDTCGIITTVGTNNNGGDTVLTVTFGKTYTNPPKAVLITPVNASAAKVATTALTSGWVSATSATTFVMHIPADAAAAATPSYNYFVIA